MFTGIGLIGIGIGMKIKENSLTEELYQKIEERIFIAICKKAHDNIKYQKGE